MQELPLLDGLPHGRQVRVKSQSRSVLSSDEKITFASPLARAVNAAAAGSRAIAHVATPAANGRYLRAP